MPPVVAITADLYDRRGTPTARVAMAYARCVSDAGATPVVLAPVPGAAPDLASRFDAFVLTGGDDPTTEQFGATTDARIIPVLADRQAFEVELLEHLRRDRPDTPVLGVCLGMQLMALVEGGSLFQHMPESHEATHADHWDRAHEIHPSVEGLTPGRVHSKHRQAVDDPGAMTVMATAADGVIEAVGMPGRRFCLGVQWHPERTEGRSLGQGLFDALVGAAGPG